MTLSALDDLSKEDLVTRDQISRSLAKDQFLRSLYDTTKFLFDYTEVNWRTHGRVIQALESSTQRKLLVLPRGSFKSSIACEAYPVWLLMNNPNLRILLDSEVYTNSKNFLRKIRALLEYEKVRDLFGSFGPTENWNEGELTISQRNKAFKEASITCSGIGAVKVGQHYDYIIFDDLNSPNNSNTPEGHQKVIDHYRMSISLLEPGGTIVVIGTRYHQNDIIGWILENEIEGQGLIRA
jgi:hypothetical protein